MKDFIKEPKYEQDFPDDKSWNWKVVTVNYHNHNKKISSVLLHDGSFVINGVHFSKEEVVNVEDDPISLFL